jgi:glycerophosphoryl diester phosphodiesterase
MFIRFRIFLTSFLLFAHITQAAAPASDKIVVAHRGASGYLPEHTLEAKVLAHAMGADYIESDVLMTSDNALVVLHDLYIDQNTDVAEVYPGRARDDGRFYVIDFTLDELRQLRVSERSRRQNGTAQPVYPDRFPLNSGGFGIHTLQEEIELIQGLNKTLGREAGIYVEIKRPWFHHQEGKDQAAAILQVLKEYGYESKDDKVFLQTFDFNELKRVREELMPALGMDIMLAQLIANNEGMETFELVNGQWLPYDYNWMHTEEGIQELARYANGIGPAMDMIVSNESTQDKLLISSLVDFAHAADMVVHPYTFRRDAGLVPDYAESFERLLEIFYFEADVDGLKTDFPDAALRLIQERE